MKKILALAVGMLLIPFTAFGMDMMSDGEMDSITGQSGVAISLANVQVYQTGGDELWYQGGSDTAAVGLVYGDSTASYTFITAIKNTATFDGGYERGDYDALTDEDLTLFNQGVLDFAPEQPRVLSIRVLAGGTENPGMFGGIDAAHIEIGLPTIEIVGAAGSSEELQLFVGATTAADDSPVGQNGNFASMGTIFTSQGSSTTAIMGGAIGITAVDSSADGTTSIGDALVMDVNAGL